MSLRDDQLATLKAAGKDFDYYNIANLDGIDHLPYSLKVLVENLVRNIDGANITDEHVKTLLDWDPNAEPSHEIQFTPSRVIMQDFTGVPCIVDLATMRDAVKDLGGDPEVINPQVQSDMVIDHSVQIDKYGVADAVEQNMDIEYQRNGERYQFLRWGQQAFRNFRVVPPGTGIIHQVNIEYLAKVVMTKAGERGRDLAYLDSCVGTDSHTTTVNGLGVLGWGVGGIEAEAAMLGQPIHRLGPVPAETAGLAQDQDHPVGNSTERNLQNRMLDRINGDRRTSRVDQGMVRICDEAGHLHRDCDCDVDAVAVDAGLCDAPAYLLGDLLRGLARHEPAVDAERTHRCDH